MRGDKRRVIQIRQGSEMWRCPHQVGRLDNGDILQNPPTLYRGDA